MNYNLATEMVETGLLSQAEGINLYPIVSGCKFIPGQVKEKYALASESDKKCYEMEVFGRNFFANISSLSGNHFFEYTTFNRDENAKKFYCRGHVIYDATGFESIEITKTKEGFFIRSVNGYDACNIKFYDLEALNTYVTIMKQEPALDAEKVFKKIGISPDKEVKILFDRSEGPQNFIGNISNNPDYAEELHNLVGLDLEENLGKSQGR